MKSIKRSIPFIKILIKSSNRINPLELLHKFPPFVIHDIIKILKYIVIGKIPITPQQLKQLKKYKNPLLKLINIHDKKKADKFIYKQHGGFIMGILPLIASLVGGIVSNVI